MKLSDLIAKESKNIVHIAIDEKFIDAAYAVYEKAFPGRNLFLILQNEEHGKIKFLNNLTNYFIIKTSFDYVKKIEFLITNASVVVFHGMNYHQAFLVEKLNKLEKKYVWSVFGAEVYSNELIVKDVALGEKTFKYFFKNYKKTIKNKFSFIYYFFFKKRYIENKVIKCSFSKMDFISILYKEELIYYIQLGIVDPKIRQIKFTYYPLDLVIESNAEYVNEVNILLGNSATHTNNHLEAFDILEKFNLRNKKVICTLSYGNKEYAKKIIDLGIKKFGKIFEPLIEFVPLKEYQMILQSCGIVIMNHYRQQAVGNVMNALYIGAKVYLSEKNTLYHYLKSIGCHIYSIENDLVPENKYAFNLLTFDQMSENRRIITKELSLNRVVSELKLNLSPIIFD